MKFCNKCHKMIVKKVVNPLNLTRFCECNSIGKMISKDVLARMRAMASGNKENKKRAMDMLGE